MFQAPIKEGDLIRHISSKQVYIIMDGVKRPIPSLAVFMSHGYDFDNVIVVTDDEIFEWFAVGDTLN